MGIVNNAFQTAKEDDELNVRILAEQRGEEIESLRNIFHDIDADGSGMLSKDEFDEALDCNEEVQQKFELLEIPEQEREEIWKLLDTSEAGDGEISVDQFTEGLQA